MERLLVCLAFYNSLRCLCTICTHQGGTCLARNGDRLDTNLRLRLGEIDMEQPIVKPCTTYLNSFRHHEGTLELPRCDAPMQAVFKQSTVDMFSMNKFLGNHLYPVDEE